MVTKIRGTGDALTPVVTGVDGDSGLFFPVADTVAIATGGLERLRIDSLGNAGLGVTPSAWGVGVKAFDLGGGSAIVNPGSSAQTWVYTNAYLATGAIPIYKNSGLGAGWYQQNEGGHTWYSAPSGTAGNPITFTQAMTLTQSGNLLVGTTSEISGVRFVSELNSAGTSGPLAIANRNSTIGATSRFQFIGYRDVGNSNGIAAIEAQGVAGTINGAAAFGGNLIFRTKSDGSDSDSTERARITSGGYFKASNTGNDPGVAGLTGAYTGGVQHSFFNNQSNFTIVAGNSSAGDPNAANFGSFLNTSSLSNHFLGALNGTTVYRVLANGNVQNTNNSYTAISDENLKENIVPASPKLPGLMEVEFVNFNFKEETGYETHKQFGVIAQQLETVFPGLVITTPDRDTEGNETGTVTKSVNYSVLALFACKALQEAKTEIDELKARIEQLESGV